MFIYTHTYIYIYITGDIDRKYATLFVSTLGDIDIMHYRL